MISLKQRVADAFGQVDLSQGIRHELWNEYYDDYPDDFPCRSDDGKHSLRMVLDCWQWPKSSDFIELNTFPDNEETPYSENIQGLTHLDDHWVFFPRDRKVFVWPVTSDIVNGGGYESITVGPSQLDIQYNHFGDGGAKLVDANKQIWQVFTAIEGKVPNVIGIFEVYMVPDIQVFYRDSQVLFDPQNQGTNSAPWCTYDPHNDRIYSSLFNYTTNNGFQIYFYTYTGPFDGLQGRSSAFTIKRYDGSPFPVYKRIQGGTIASRAHLYLASDNRGIDENNRGVSGFDLVSGRQMVYLHVDRIAPTYDYEIEGLTAWDVSQKNAPFVGGVLHLSILNNDAFEQDNMFIKHWDLPANKRHLL